MAELKMWAIREPTDRLVPWTVRRTRREALDEWLYETRDPELQWRREQRRGYRCVRVLVTEIEP